MAPRGEPVSRRQLIKSFGLSAFLIHPVLRSMAMAAEAPLSRAPRYVMFFKGGAYYPSRTNPSTIASLAGTPIAPLEAHAKDIILFKGMNVHGGSPKTDGYKEEHAGGLFGCTTGNSYRYFKNDAYFAYTDHESIDVRMANHYAGRADTKSLPLKSLHIGAGAHSDADQVGVGNRFISFRNRVAGDDRYGNAIHPIQDAGAVYDLLLRAAAGACSAQSNQPRSDADKLEAARASNVNPLDFMRSDVKHAHDTWGSEAKGRINALQEGISQLHRSVSQQARDAPAGAIAAPAAVIGGRGCASGKRPSGNGANKKNLDELSPIHDQMIDLIKLAFQLDLTRVVAFTLSGASSGQSWPSRGVTRPHHELEHNGNVDALVKIDTYYSEKYAALLAALKSIDDGDGRNALHNSSVLLGMECWSNSSSGHYLTDIPFVFAGQGGGRFKTGQIVNAGGRNINDLHVSCLNAAGLETSAFGLASLCKGPII